MADKDNLPSQFSASSLQDYQDCPRRFQLRYLEQVSWPAIESEPVLENERFIRMGADFHKLIQQYFCGIPLERLQGMIRDAQLAYWWDNFLAFIASGELEGKVYAEVALSTAVAGARLLAKFDLVVVRPDGTAVIYDWKTSRRRPRRARSKERLQTNVYPYVLLSAGRSLALADDFAPEQISLVYWFANFPEAPEAIRYDEAQYRQDERFLSSTIERIRQLSPQDYPKTDRIERCPGCQYRSLCERGVQAAEEIPAEAIFDHRDEGGSFSLADIDEIIF